MPRETETMLTLSESWLTTHASSFVRGLTDTGSRPTGISAIQTGAVGMETSNTERALWAVLTANRRVPSGDKRTGLVCAPSKLSGDADCPSRLVVSRIVMTIAATPTNTAGETRMRI